MSIVPKTSPGPIASRLPARPAWEVAYLFPLQGQWTEADCLSLNASRLVEFVDGKVEILPMPTEAHQSIV